MISSFRAPFRRFRLLSFLLLLSTPLVAFARDWYFPLRLSLGPELDRPVVSSLARGEGEAWLRWDHFSPSFDFLDYADALPASATRLDAADTVAVGLNRGLGRRLTLRWSYGDLSSTVVRDLPPYDLTTDAAAHELRLQWLVHDRPPFRAALEAGYRRHDAEPLDVWEYWTSTWRVTALGDEPVFTLHAEDAAVVVGVRGFWSASRRWHVHGGLERRDVDVHAWMESASFSDPIIGPRLEAEAPQSEPWSEVHLVADLGVEWTPSRRWSGAVGVTRYRISRSGYVPNPAKEDYEANIQVDAWLFWHRWRSASVFVHGRASTNFLLGDQPFLYNQRTNHRFDDPYGYLSLGFVRRF